MTTGALPAGSLLVDPADAGVLAVLAREGARSLAARRPLSDRAAAVLMAVEQAAYAARSAAGTAAVPAGEALGASRLTVERTAEVLQVSRSYVRRLCRAGTLAADRSGPVWLVDADAVAALALSRRGVA